MFENLHENRNKIMARNINENNMSEYTTSESTNSAQDVSQTGTSANTQFPLNLEVQLEILIQDKIHTIHNLHQILLHNVP